MKAGLLRASTGTGLEDPPSLFARSAVRITLAIAAVVLILGAVGLERILAGYVVSLAQADAERVSKGLVASQADLILTMGPQRRLVLDLSDEDIGRLDSAILAFAPSLDIVKVKLYSPDATILYSTDPTIIGVTDEGNDRLAQVLEGTITSTVEPKDATVDLERETRFDVDVAETYVPIYNVQAEVVGAFEIYQDITRFQMGVRTRLLRYLALLATVVVGSTGVAIAILRRKARTYASAHAELVRIAKTDLLTGTHERSAAYERADQECNRMKRRLERDLDPSLALVLVEIDGFDGLETRHGRGSGEAALAEVARRLRATVRSYDVLGRAGSASFMLVLPETSLPEAATLAERLRVVVERTPVTTPAGPIPVTTSLGVAITFGPSPSVDVVLERAETALREAKESGGNRAVYVTSDGEPSVVDR